MPFNLFWIKSTTTKGVTLILSLFDYFEIMKGLNIMYFDKDRKAFITSANESVVLPSEPRYCEGNEWLGSVLFFKINTILGVSSLSILFKFAREKL